MHENTEGKHNLAGGYQALMANTTGNNNTALGWGTLAAHPTGVGEHGDRLGRGSESEDREPQHLLGHPGSASEARTLRLGNLQTRAFIAGVAGKPVTGTTVLINSAGKLGTLVSSARYKRDIQDMGERSQKLLQLRPVTFRYKQDAQGQRQYGLIAEEVAKVYPELVTKGTDGKIESVQYQEVIPMLLNEVQRQQQTLTTQTQQLSVQAQEMTTLKAQNAQLQETLAQQNATILARLAQVEGEPHGATLASR